MSKLDAFKQSVSKNVGTIAPLQGGLVKTFHERLDEETEQNAKPVQKEPQQATGETAERASKATSKKATQKTGRIERLSVSMPSEDLARITKVRKRAARRGDIYPKSHIVRAALIHLDSLEDSKVLEILEAVSVVKLGKENNED